MEVADFLDAVQADLWIWLNFLRPAAYLHFERNHRRQIWYRAGTNDHPLERRDTVPLFRNWPSSARTAASGCASSTAGISHDLRDVSNPANTTYRSETYFSRACSLPPGEVYVSHVTGWHIDRDQQLQGAPSPLAAVTGPSTAASCASRRRCGMLAGASRVWSSCPLTIDI